MLYRAEMDHRTGTGRFKKVMWYHKGLGYGNDILNQPVQVWNERHMAELAEFSSRFFPNTGGS